jgi:hypothetical protein
MPDRDTLPKMMSAIVEAQMKAMILVIAPVTVPASR